MGSLWASRDEGQTFTQLSAPIGELYVGVAVSSDFQHLYAIADGNNLAPAIYYSSNAGATWTPYTTFATFPTWAAIACSSDGRTVVASTIYAQHLSNWEGGLLYLSTNYGQSWQQIQGAPFMNWGRNGLAISGDGKVIAAAGADPVQSGTPSSGYIYVSLDGGEVGVSRHVALLLSSRLIHIADGHDCTYMEPSTAYRHAGATWSKSGSPNIASFFTSRYCSGTVAISKDGSRIVAGLTYPQGPLWFSYDYGANYFTIG